MKASKFTEAQKAFILKQGEQGTPVAAILSGLIGSLSRSKPTCIRK